MIIVAPIVECLEIGTSNPACQSLGCMVSLVEGWHELLMVIGGRAEGNKMKGATNLE